MKTPPDLEALIQQAEARGLWLFTPYQQLWFSPRELREHNEAGEYRWGAVNWKLRDPKELLAQREADVVNAQRELAAVRERIKRRN